MGDTVIRMGERVGSFWARSRAVSKIVRRASLSHPDYSGSALVPEKVSDFIVRAQSIHGTMAANTGTLPSPSPALTTLASHISDLASKEAAAQARTVGAVADRDAARKVVADDLNNERAYVEQLVNADPTNGAIIAQDAGMTLRKVPSRNKPDLAANKGAVSGSTASTEARPGSTCRPRPRRARRSRT